MGWVLLRRLPAHQRREEETVGWISSEPPEPRGDPTECKVWVKINHLEKRFPGRFFSAAIALSCPLCIFQSRLISMFRACGQVSLRDDLQGGDTTTVLAHAWGASDGEHSLVVYRDGMEVYR